MVEPPEPQVDVDEIDWPMMTALVDQLSSREWEPGVYFGSEANQQVIEEISYARAAAWACKEVEVVPLVRNASLWIDGVAVGIALERRMERERRRRNGQA